ncbi:MAG: FMN-binding protein, partial [Firmicutes bacterium]|nr:FMN-binding protein [Bacillota bacterium]
CAPKGSAAKAPSDEASVATVGSGMGKHGSIQVEVITKNGAIERIDVLDSRESAGLGDVCMDKLGKLIVEGQTLNVDVVSGASLSSMAYLTAVAEALDKAGEKSSEWKKRDKALQRPDNDIPTSYDVVIVGAGGAGFTAAISAANKGKKVLLMEKLGAVPERTLMVGDTAVDIACGTNVGIATCGVLWGFRDREQLVEAKAAELAADTGELHALLEK